jgi:bifunctional DNA-binding transcriptional regulator/antitoxin component of YhaV-PrlF toxin-antitoxin module
MDKKIEFFAYIDSRNRVKIPIEMMRAKGWKTAQFVRVVVDEATEKGT